MCNDYKLKVPLLLTSSNDPVKKIEKKKRKIKENRAKNAIKEVNLSTAEIMKEQNKEHKAIASHFKMVAKHAHSPKTHAVTAIDNCLDL